MRRTSGIACLALLSLTATVDAQVADANRKASDFDSYVARAVKDWNTTGLAIAVVKDGQVVFAKGYGVRELGKSAAVDTSTLFAIASTTKAITAAALGLLVDGGRLSWDDPVTRHLPTFQLYDPYVTREVTIRDLLTHRAGLGNADYFWYVNDLSADSLVEKLRLLKPEYSLRSGFIYNNAMYIAAGQVVAAVSGMPWEKFVQTRIFGPIGMSRTYPLLSLVPPGAQTASPHWSFAPQTVSVIGVDKARAVGPAGDAWSSAGDMSKWMRFLLDSGRVDGKALLEPATFAELFTPQTMVPSDEFYPSQQLTKPNWRTYGLGWFQHDYQGKKLDFHTGSLAGMVAILGLVRDEQFGVFISANLDHSEIRHALMYRAIDTWLDNAERDWSSELKLVYDKRRVRNDSVRAARESRRIKGTKPSIALTGYVGAYENPIAGTVSVQQSNGTLRFVSGKALRGVLDHWQYDRFSVRYDDRWQGNDAVAFTIGDGIASALDYAGFTFRRVPDAQPVTR